MKYLILFIPFILSCATSQKETTRSIASSQPARILKVSKPHETQLPIDKYSKVEIELKAFKFGTSIAKDRTAKFKMISGSGNLEASSITSNASGLIKNIYYSKGFKGSVVIEVKVDRVTKKINFEMIRPSKFVGAYSLSKTTFDVDKKITKASGKETLSFKIQIKDKTDKNIDAYGLDVRLDDGLKRIKMKDMGEGLYTIAYKVGTGNKDTNFSFSINEYDSSSKIAVVVNPVISFANSSIIFEVLEDGKIKVLFPLTDLRGKEVREIERVQANPIANISGGVFSKISYDSKREKYFYIFTPKKGKGKIGLGININGDNYISSNEVSYEYTPNYISFLKVELENTKIIPTGKDHLDLKIIPFNKENKQVKLTKLSKVISVDLIGCGKVYDLEPNKKFLINARVVPNYGCKEIELIVKAKGKVYFEKILNFDFEPIQEKIILKRSVSSSGYSKTFGYQYSKGRGYKTRTGKTRALNLSNEGINSIIPSGCAKDADDNRCQASRDFNFHYLDQARQNIELTVTDVPTDWTSHMMGSMFYFFPRIVIPHAEFSDDKSQIIVTLPTNEKVYFDTKTKEIVGGVLEEGPIDLGPVRFSRKFPNIRYKGTGIVLRINARGSEPRFGQFNNTQISGDFGNTGGRGVLIYKYDKNTDEIISCYGKKINFWPQKDTSPIPFIMYSDEKFNTYLKQNCSFSL